MGRETRKRRRASRIFAFLVWRVGTWTRREDHLFGWDRWPTGGGQPCQDDAVAKEEAAGSLQALLLCQLHIVDTGQHMQTGPMTGPPSAYVNNAQRDRRPTGGPPHLPCSGCADEKCGFIVPRPFRPQDHQGPLVGLSRRLVGMARPSAPQFSPMARLDAAGGRANIRRESIPRASVWKQFKAWFGVPQSLSSRFLGLTETCPLGTT